MRWINEEKLLKYRINMKNRLEKMLEENNRVAMQEPTGIGKSYMMIEICKEKEGNKIIFEPTRVLADKFEDDIKGTNTKTMIYQNLLRLSDTDLKNLFKDIDYLFLDEVHRIGAEQWGAQIKKVFKMFPNMKIIGLTATPVRTDKINVFTEFFNDIQTEPMDLFTAINEHLLPQITYVTAYASILKEVESRREAIQQSKLLFSETKNEYLRVLEVYRHKLESIMNIPKILKKYIKLEKIDNKNFKVLLFVSRLNQIDEAEKESLKWFNEAFPEKKINIYKLGGKGNNRKNNKQQVDNFEDNSNINEIDIMISVNKLIEGFHIKRVSAAIFLRRTCSNIVFLQQIGRTLSESEPIIFDLVENHKNVGNGLEWDFERFRKNIKNYTATKKDDKINKPIIWLNDELKETEEIFKKFSLSNKLTKNEIKYLEENRKLIPIAEIARNLNRCRETLVNFCNKNNLDYIGSGRIYLSDEDKQFILDNCNKMTIKEICVKLNLNDKQVRTFIEKNNLKFKRQTIEYGFYQENHNKIVEYFNNGKSIKEISEILNCNYDGLRNYMNKNNIRIPRVNNEKEFSKEEQEFILNNFRFTSYKTIAEQLGTSKQTVQKFIKKSGLLKLERIPESKVKFILDNYKSMNTSELALSVELSRKSVTEILSRNNLTYEIRKNYVKKETYRSPQRFLTTNEIEYIKENMGKIPLKQIADSINTSVELIKRELKKHKIELKKAKRSDSITEKEEEFILNNYNKMTTTEIGKFLNRDRHFVADFLRKNNLNSRMKGCKTTFTDEQIRFLKENIGKISASNICKSMGNISVGSLKSICERYNIEYKTYKRCSFKRNEVYEIINNNLNKILSLINNGESANKISKNFSIDPRYLLDYFKENNINYTLKLYNRKS